MIATGSLDMTAKLWNVSDGRLLATLEEHTSSVLHFSLTLLFELFFSPYSPDFSLRFGVLPSAQTERLWRRVPVT
jgi:WD40 repeat protein